MNWRYWEQFLNVKHQHAFWVLILFNCHIRNNPLKPVNILYKERWIEQKRIQNSDCRLLGMWWLMLYVSLSSKPLRQQHCPLSQCVNSHNYLKIVNETASIRNCSQYEKKHLFTFHSFSVVLHESASKQHDSHQSENHWEVWRKTPACSVWMRLSVCYGGSQ